jgi:hypothetical protein
MAIATMILFVLGLPIAFAVFLWRNRREIEVDQELRQRGEGYSALTNPYHQVCCGDAQWSVHGLAVVRTVVAQHRYPLPSGCMTYLVSLMH